MSERDKARKLADSLDLMALGSSFITVKGVDVLHAAAARLKDQAETIERLEAKYDELKEINHITVRDGNRELKRLQSIVDKLSKTADGVPVVLGIKVYQRDATGFVQGYDVGQNRARDDSSRPSEAYLVFNQNCYSTREAAEAGKDGD